MSNGSETNNQAPLVQLLAQLVQGQQTFEQAMTQLLAQPTPAVQASQSGAPKASVAEPDDYDGQYENFDTFMSQLYLLFAAKPRAYASDHMKIVSTLSYMKKGLAGVWATNVTRQLREHTLVYRDWEEFESKLKETFDDPNKKRVAQVKLKALKKTVKQSADEYFAEFDHLAARAGFNDEALLDILQENLDKPTFDAIVAAPQVDRTLAAWKEYAKKYDRNKRANERTERVDTGGGTRRPWFRPNMAGGRNLPNTGPGAGNTEGQGTGTRTTDTGGGRVFPGRGEPMDLDRQRGRTGPIKCFNCGELGHVARNCPKTRGAQMMKTMFDNLSVDQKKEVMQIFGIEERQEVTQDFLEGRE